MKWNRSASGNDVLVGTTKLWVAVVKKIVVDHEFCFSANLWHEMSQTFPTREEAMAWAQTVARLKGHT